MPEYHYESQYIKFNCVSSDLSRRENLIESIEAQTGLGVTESNYIYCYKHVRANLSSLHDSNYIYKMNDWNHAENSNEDSKVSCGSGLHVSHKHYWNGNSGKKVLFCKVHLDDILAVQEGKIRCRKLFVLESCIGKVY